MEDINIEFYNLEEIKSILKNKDRLVYVDDGSVEVVIKYEDLPDFIVKVGGKLGSNYPLQLKVYDFERATMTPILTTSGEFLDKCDPEIRKDIIERLMRLQTNEEKIKEFKVIDESTLEDARNDLEQEIDYNNVKDNPDIEQGKVFKIQDYYCEIDDFNFDNLNESIVFIYESKEKLDEGEYLEQVSLLNKDIKSNIEEYINENYYSDISESERAYFAFVLGYDLLNRNLKKNLPECDLSYDFCNMLATKFLRSKEYKNEKYSGYEMLCEWIDKNRFDIKKELIPNCPLKNRKLSDEEYIVDFGYVNDELNILVEEKKDNSRRFKIGFNCIVENEKVNCNYVIYFDNKSRAIQEFNNIIKNVKIKNKRDMER